MTEPELQRDVLCRVHAVNLAISYYKHCAKQPLFLPKRDDVDMVVEISPNLLELLTTADEIFDYLADGLLPADGC